MSAGPSTITTVGVQAAMRSASKTRSRGDEELIGKLISVMRMQVGRKVLRRVDRKVRVDRCEREADPPFVKLLKDFHGDLPPW